MDLDLTRLSEANNTFGVLCKQTARRKNGSLSEIAPLKCPRVNEGLLILLQAGYSTRLLIVRNFIHPRRRLIKAADARRLHYIAVWHLTNLHC